MTTDTHTYKALFRRVVRYTWQHRGSLSSHSITEKLHVSMYKKRLWVLASFRPGTLYLLSSILRFLQRVITINLHTPNWLAADNCGWQNTHRLLQRAVNFHIIVALCSRHMRQLSCPAHQSGSPVTAKIQPRDRSWAQEIGAAKIQKILIKQNTRWLSCWPAKNQLQRIVQPFQASVFDHTGLTTGLLEGLVCSPIANRCRIIPVHI